MSITRALSRDHAVMQIYNRRALPGTDTAFCVRVLDSLQTGDSEADTLALDCVYLLPAPPGP